MTADDEIPEHDPLAESARRGLQRMAGTSAVDLEPWGAVHARGRRRKQLRIATAAAATVVVLAAGTAVVANTAGSQDHVSVAGPNETTTSAPSDTSTSSSAPPTVPPTAPCVGACGTVVVPPPVTTAPTPSAAPGPADFTGTITVSGDQVVWSMALGESVDITASVTNVSDHTIVTSSSLQPTSLATVCTSEASGAQSLWWMTNTPLDPGVSTGRGGPFVPTDPYLGTVRCAVDIVTTNQQGTTFDTGAGGDSATTTILAEVTTIAPLVITVQEPQPTTTTTTLPATTTTG